MAKKKKAVPVLRFPEFEDEWQLHRLGEFIDDRKDVATSDLPLFSLTIESGIVPKSKRYERSFLVKSEADAYKRMKPKDFAYNPMNLRWGALACHHGDAEIAVSKYYDIFSVNQKSVPEYLEPFLTSYKMVQFYDRMSTGTLDEKKRVHYLDFVNFKKLFPTLPEQRKIAGFLTAVVGRIQQLSQKLTLLQDYKKGVMQQLFTQALRFKDDRRNDFPDWEEKELGDSIDLLSGFPFASEDILDGEASKDREGVLLMRGVNITEGEIRHSKDQDRFYCGDVSKLEKYRLEVGDMVIGMDGSKVGKNSALVGEIEKGALLVQRVARIRPVAGVSLKYIYHHVNSPLFHRYVDRVKTSSGIPHISAKQIREFKIGFPCFPEQTKIANFLTALDRKIEGVAHQITHTQTFKKGLLQQMFV